MRRDPDWLLAQLPVGMLQDDFFRRFVSIFQAVGTTCAEDIDNLEHVIDPTVAPAPLLPWLGTWVGIRVVEPSLPVETQRDLVRTAGRSLAWRGTRRGLVPFLELVSGGPVDLEETGGVWREGEAPRGTPQVRIRVRSTGWLPDEDLVELVRAELPVHVELTLHVGDRQLWPEPVTIAAPGSSPVIAASDPAVDTVVED